MSRSVLRVNLSNLNRLGRCHMRSTYRTFRRSGYSRSQARTLVYMMGWAIDRSEAWIARPS